MPAQNPCRKPTPSVEKIGDTRGSRSVAPNIDRRGPVDDPQA
jgi:hypothetical protein